MCLAVFVASDNEVVVVRILVVTFLVAEFGEIVGVVGYAMGYLIIE